MAKKQIELEKDELHKSYIRSLNDIQAYHNYSDIQMSKILLDQSLSYLKNYLIENNKKELIEPIENFIKSIQNIQ